VGSFPALAYQHTQTNSAKQFFISLARSAGVPEEVQLSGPGASDVEVRRLIEDNKQIVFVFSRAKNPFDATLSIALPWKAQRARNLSDESAVAFQMSGGKAVLHKRLANDEIWVFTLEGPPTS
jgi:hypothetical protein